MKTFWELRDEIKEKEDVSEISNKTIDSYRDKAQKSMKKSG